MATGYRLFRLFPGFASISGCGRGPYGDVLRLLVLHALRVPFASGVHLFGLFLRNKSLTGRRLHSGYRGSRHLRRNRVRDKL